jgi:2,4-dichlorophenol 6-monooxygenase
MTEFRVPVLIVGGGGAGLTASMLLSTYGVDSMLVSRSPRTSQLPKAHVLNQRTMEILTEVGVADTVYDRGTPPQNMRATAWYAGVAGDDPNYGRELGRLEVWGGGYTDPDYVAASPCRTSNLPQLRLEPILKAHAESLGHSDIRFNHELLGIDQDADGVTATVLDRATDERYTVRSDYLLGADGGHVVGQSVGIAMSGPRDLMKLVSVHLGADLSEWLTDDEVLIRWLVNPDFGGSWASGILVPMGPDHWGTKSEEWVFHMQYATDDPEAMQEDKVMDRMRATLGIPDFSPQVFRISSWVMEGVIAERFRAGRVFLLGDAAHRHPPTGGLGLNSAIHDAYNLVWKLVAVLRGQAGDGLLDTYEDERRTVDQHNIDNAIANAMNHYKIDEALGLSPDKTAEENWAELRPLWDELPGSREKRQGLNIAVGSQTMEFRHHNVEFGYTYSSAAVIDDGGGHAPLDPVRLYEPSTRPGHPLPHAWVEREGSRIPLGTLVGDAAFLLIAGEDGAPWLEAAEKLAAEHDVPLRAIRVGVVDGDYIDVRCAWLKHREITSAGAVLVRPDRYVGFRSPAGVVDPYTVLADALGRILSTKLTEGAL